MEPDQGSIDVSAIARDVAARVNEQLPAVILELLQGGFDVRDGPLQLECHLSSIHSSDRPRRIRIAALDIDSSLTPSRSDTPLQSDSFSPRQTSPRNLRIRSLPISPDVSSTDVEGNPRPTKRRKDTGGLRIGSSQQLEASDSNAAVRRLECDHRVFPQRKKRLPENPALQPSTLDKFIGGVWESIYSSVKLDPTQVIDQWQAIESNGQPRLITDAEHEQHELSLREDSAARGSFGRMNVLTCKISQTSRTCRSLEVIVQAHWVQCFDDRVKELAESMPREKAKKATIAEACVDFHWSEKELRNKMGIWRGYHDIKTAGGWAALVFAGMGLYRFCKYRGAFTEDMFQVLRTLRHRFEVAADTLHPNWRQLLAIVGGPTKLIYTGHPHDWVVGASHHEAITLPETYRQWDDNFTYKHIEECAIDEEKWGLFDPRVENATALTTTTANNDTADDDERPFICDNCALSQSDDPRVNACTCFPTLYGSPQASAPPPVQVYRTPSGMNNGLIACLAFERGSAVGEFVGEVTSGMQGKDVMVGATSRAKYQIWQGKQGNHTRFVNHSCSPNAQFEPFVWRGVQKKVLVSKGIEAGEEITFDYTDSYWKYLDKECLCGQPRCRYKRRDRNLPPLSPPAM